MKVWTRKIKSREKMKMKWRVKVITALPFLSLSLSLSLSNRKAYSSLTVSFWLMILCTPCMYFFKRCKKMNTRKAKRVCVYIYICVCVCVCVRERKSKGAKVSWQEQYREKMRWILPFLRPFKVLSAKEILENKKKIFSF